VGASVAASSHPNSHPAADGVVPDDVAVDDVRELHSSRRRPVRGSVRSVDLFLRGERRAHMSVLVATVAPGTMELLGEVMRGRDRKVLMETNGHQLEGVTLTWVSDGRTDRWSIEVAAVQWLLDRVSAGDFDLETVRTLLCDATAWLSGCCDGCDAAMGYYEEALRRHHSQVAQWNRLQKRKSARNSPYVANKGKIHRSGCRHLPQPEPPKFPVNLHEFARWFDGTSGDGTQDYDDLDRCASRNPQSLELDRIEQMIARQGWEMVKSKACRSCRPHIPNIDPRSPHAVPACWTWDAHEALITKTRAKAAADTSIFAHIPAEHRVDYGRHLIEVPLTFKVAKARRSSRWMSQPIESVERERQGRRRADSTLAGRNRVGGAGQTGGVGGNPRTGVDGWTRPRSPDT
jgi:hypothetical protein